jgi:hypothetical protein
MTRSRQRRRRRVAAYLLARLQEPSSWACGLTLIGAGIGAKIAPEHALAITEAGVIAAGALKAFLPDRWREEAP